MNDSDWALEDEEKEEEKIERKETGYQTNRRTEKTLIICLFACLLTYSSRMSSAILANEGNIPWTSAVIHVLPTTDVSSHASSGETVLARFHYIGDHSYLVARRHPVYISNNELLTLKFALFDSLYTDG